MELHELARAVGEELGKRSQMLVAAESCTGGGLAQAMTAIAGSSAWFERGYVTYSNASKREMLGVDSATLATRGAVSQQTVEEMARGALARSHAHVSVAITGIAGPSGGSPEKPVGTVWIGWANEVGTARSQQFLFHGDRETIRASAVEAALQGVLELLR